MAGKINQDETEFYVILALMAFLIFISNLIVLMAIIKCERLHVTRNIFLAGMAFADATVGALGLPLRLIVTLHLEMSYYTCFHINCIHLYFLDMPLLLQFAFTLEQLYARCFPLRYYQRFGCKNAMIVILVVWMLGLLVAYSPVFMVEDDHHKAYEGICSFTDIIPSSYLVYVGFITMYLGTLLVVILVNSYIVCTMGHRRGGLIEINDVRQNDPKAKNAKMLLSMITAYVFTGLPLGICDLLWQLGYPQNNTLIRALTILYYLNSFINPNLYAFSNKKIMTACTNLIMCRTIGDGTASITIRSPISSPDKSAQSVVESSYFSGSIVERSMSESIETSLNVSSTEKNGWVAD